MTASYDDPRLTAVGLMIETHGGLIARLNEVHGKYGLAGTDFDVLVRLLRSPGRRLRMGDLATQTALSTSGITRIVDRLERDGLTHRVRTPDDRRGWTVTLTDAGRARIDALLPDLLATIETYLTSQLTPAQLDHLLEALHLVRDAVRPGATAGAEGD